VFTVLYAFILSIYANISVIHVTCDKSLSLTVVCIAIKKYVLNWKYS